MEPPPNVPALAIASFERLTGLSVSVHDYGGALWAWLPPDRFEHLNPHCRVVKSVRQGACTAFDARLVAAKCQDHNGFVKVCHAGFVEWVVPRLDDGQLRWVLFAGVRRPAPGLQHVLSDPSVLTRGGSWSSQLARLPAVDDGEALFVLESLRQLNQRLVTWNGETAPGIRENLPRGEAIRHFLIRHHAKVDLSLSDLAGHLGLSESRAGHTVSESCGMTFVALLTELRMRTAAGLLRHSGLSVSRIMAEAGFGNRAHFHTRFRAAFGTTPARYRRDSATGLQANQA